MAAVSCAVQGLWLERRACNGHARFARRLAELQLRILWEEVLKRFDRIEVVDEPERTLSAFINGYTKLPVQITRKR